MLNKMPKSVRIGSKDYGVEVVDSINDGTCGRFDSNKGVISVSKRVEKEQNKADTLLHEMLHAIFYQSGSFLTEKDREEQFVVVLTEFLVQVIRDNPKLMLYLMEACNAKR